MDFEKRLEELKDYNIAFEIKQGYYHVSLVYDENWDIVDCDNEALYIEKRKGICHYIGSTDSIKIDDIFNAIQETIDYNLDMQKKLLLFKQKTEELQDIFARESIEVLETIEFRYGIQDKKEEKTKKKRGRKPKKESETVIKNEEVSDQNTDKEEEKIVIPEENIKEDNLNQIDSSSYEEDDEVVIMNSDDFMEELERK